MPNAAFLDILPAVPADAPAIPVATAALAIVAVACFAAGRATFPKRLAEITAAARNRNRGAAGGPPPAGPRNTS